MRLAIFAVLFMFVSTGFSQQLEFDFGDSQSIIENTTFMDENIRVTYSVPEAITKAWDERDFGFEIADGYYGYGPSAQYEILNDKNEVVGYMLAQTLSYSEDPEYHVAYTVCDINGTTVVELEYEVYSVDEAQTLPLELRPEE